MRKIETHKVNGCNEALSVAALDDPGMGGASHMYVIYAPNDAFNEELNASVVCHLSFQNGPLKTAGVNGITHEALLAVLIDRLEGFQGGKFACAENAEALEYLYRSQHVLKSRTEKRLARGVEGTHQV